MTWCIQPHLRNEKDNCFDSNVQTSNRTSFSRGFSDASKNTTLYRNHPFNWRWITSAGFCGGKYVHKKDFC